MAAPIALIVNPAAGGGRAEAVLPALLAALADLGLEARPCETTGLEHARALAAEAAASGATVVTLGGDGLLGAVAGALAGTDAVVGVLPGGRGNDFARVLGIPADPAAACAVIAGGRVASLDVGDVDGRAFVGIASCGFDSDANRIANEATIVTGNLVYAYAALRALAEWRPARFEVTIDGHETLSFSGYSVVAANSKAYGGGMFVAPGAELDDGLLDLVLTGAVTKRRFLANLPKVFKGTHVKEPAVHVRRAASVRIAADRQFTVYADGDPIGELPATVSIRPAALRVLVPA
jgi:YegS/Rv2252/BmrU family lipid kinase